MSPNIWSLQERKDKMYISIREHRTDGQIPYIMQNLHKCSRKEYKWHRQLLVA